MKKYNPQICPTCHQTTTYVLALDKGIRDIVRAVAIAIGKKGINQIHPRREMESKTPEVHKGTLSSNQVGNLSRARMHGMIAKIKGNPGNYCLTAKGAKFLKGEQVPAVAILDKALGRQIGYWPEAGLMTIKEFIDDDPYWIGINYEIREGHVVVPQINKALPL
jgi:hypothetical protein